MNHDQPLFVEEQEPVTKTAMDTRLSDDANTWVQEILREAHRQCPFLGQYEVTPQLNKVDDERGYALGFLKVNNRTNRLPTPSGSYLSEQAGVRVITIPILVQERMLQSLDVFVDAQGRYLPLNENRIRQAMFRPDVFDSYGMPPTQTTLIGDRMVPPDRSERMISGRGISISQGEVKLSSDRSLLRDIAPSILKSDIERVESAMASDPDLARRLITKEASRPFIQMLAELDPVTPADVARISEASLVPDVVQLTRNGDEYVLKMASSRFWKPKTVTADRIKMAEIVGADMVNSADSSGVATLSADPVIKPVETTPPSKVEMAERFGEWRVRDISDQEHLGWVFPSVSTFEGVAVPLKIFTNGSVAGVQSDIAGIFVGKSTDIMSSDTLEGDGFFYNVDSNGNVVAYVPGTIVTAFEDEQGPGIVFDPVMGGEVQLRLASGVTAPVRTGDMEYAIPDTVKWCPLTGTSIALNMNPELHEKTAEALNLSDCVSIVSDGKLWSFSGPPLSKLAASERELLEADDAMFLACSLGSGARYAMKKLAEAARRGKVVLNGCRSITPVMEHVKTAEAEARRVIAEMPKKYVLLKEAADLDDIHTIDKVLSLGFITPENVATFMDYIPDLEACVQRLAKLLVSTRLGLNLPVQSVKNSMLRVEEVLQSLKKLLYRSSEPV